MNFRIINGMKRIKLLKKFLLEIIKNKNFQKKLKIKAENSQPYSVRLPSNRSKSNPTIIHVIANFMIGGSSRLVVDLIENLSPNYNHKVITSFVPYPPAFNGLDIEEFNSRVGVDDFLKYFKKNKPFFIHIHYWGECDEHWYAKAFRAAEVLKIPVIQNINTPVSPFKSETICTNVFVSNFVKKAFGEGKSEDTTIYPGSDLSHFNPSKLRHYVEPTEFKKRFLDKNETWIGMVYRLELDKLNENSINPFIKIVQKRPSVKALIVGGGSLQKIFMEKVAQAGIRDNFFFTGYVAYKDLPYLYSKLSLFLAPVWKESFGQVSVFSMMMGVPVIGYDIGAIKELINDERLLVKYGNEDGLSEIALRLLDSHELYNESVKLQKSRAENLFSLSSMIEKYKQLYQWTINKYSKIETSIKLNA